MPIDPERATSLALAASGLADPSERAAYLDRECGGDAKLRGRVEALLRANDAAPLSPVEAGDATVASDPGALPHGGTGDYTPQPDDAAPYPPGTTDIRPRVDPGLVIAGRYTLVEKIGEGGMGEVWVARQTEPVKRQVALKLIKTGMDSRAVLARFEQERQALALMDHPNIARVLDGGMTPTGQPFFVMELVNGLPLTRFCDEMKLTPRERLELFVPICQAVQHAHQKGIIHRDLKPANILVTTVDARPVPKVIDFGVAKATAGKLTDESMATQFGAVVGTLEYMSPEQAGFSGEDVDTRADVYSLGVILYELLTGLRPIDARRLKKAAFTEMIRIIREDEPSKPSTRLSTNESLPSLAALRQVEPKRLMALLRGELDWVVMKCLEKQRERRYETASGLARDVQRYLADEVVEARPPSAAYRLRKFVRRHKGQVIAASLVLLALLAGMAGTTWGLIEARRQEQFARAETAAKEQARADEAEKAEGERLARLDAVAATEKAVAAEKSEAVLRAQAEQNANLAGMQATLALNTIQDLVSQVQNNLNGPGLFDLKKSLLDSALKRVDGVAGVYEKSTSKEATTLAALMELAKIYRQTGRADKAYPVLQRCLDIAKERVKIKNHSDPSRRNLANIYFELAFCSEEFHRDLQQVLSYNREGLRLYEDIEKMPKLDDFPLDRKEVRAGLAEAYTRVGVTEYRLGNLLDARANFRKAYDLRRALVEELKDNPGVRQDLSYSSMALAEVSYRLGDKVQADSLYRETLEQRAAMFDLKPKDQRVAAELASVNYMIGEFKLKTGDLVEARKRLEKCKEIRESLVKQDDKNALLKRDLAIVLYRLGSLADREKDEKAATTAFEAAREIEEKLVSQDPTNDRRLLELMQSLAHVGQVDRAAEIADRMIAGPRADNELRIVVAGTYAQCARHTPAAQGEKALAFRVKAVEAVRAAVREGYRDRAYLEDEPDLDPVRDREDFRKLVAEVASDRK
jgi:serine/threonine protein kinase/tetratricopeptide (TPR) repeat protein